MQYDATTAKHSDRVVRYDTTTRQDSRGNAAMRLMTMRYTATLTTRQQHRHGSARLAAFNQAPQRSCCKTPATFTICKSYTRLTAISGPKYCCTAECTQ
jgi:hypothetical protein